MCLSLLPAPKTLFLPLGCLVQPQYEGFLFTLLYLAFFSVCLSSFGGLVFSEGEKEGEWIWGRGGFLESRRRITGNCGQDILY